MAERMIEIIVEVDQSEWFKLAVNIAKMGYFHVKKADKEFEESKKYLVEIERQLKMLSEACSLLNIKIKEPLIELPIEDNKRRISLEGSLDEIVKKTSTLVNDFHAIAMFFQNKLDLLENTIERKNEILETIKKIKLDFKFRFFSVNFGLVFHENANRLMNIAREKNVYVVLSDLPLGYMLALLVAGRDDKDKLKEVFDDTDITPLGNYIRVLDMIRYENLDEFILAIRGLREALQNIRRILFASLNFERKNDKVRIRGYIPSEKLKDFEDKILEKFPDATIIQEKRKISIAPVYIKSPIKNIMAMAGLPRHGEADPSPIFTITFPLFFGMMFGDIGHGLVLAIVGLLLRKLSPSRSKREWGLILVLMGIFAVFFGILSGEVFGIHVPFYKPVISIFSEHDHGEVSSEKMLFLLGLSMLIGVMHITIGYAFKIINLIHEGETREALLFYVPLVITYLSAVIFIGSTEYAGRVISRDIGTIAQYIMFACIILMIFGQPSKIFFNLVEFFISALELASNTISYARLVILYTVHVLLSSAVNMALALGFAGLPIVVIGNVGIIALEGLLAFIQSLRLHFYEFFSKFYHGGGEPYRPLLLDLRLSRILLNFNGKTVILE